MTKVPDGAHVLVVDDEVSMREFLGVMLRKIGCKLTTAASGDAAIELLQAEHDFGVVITDLKMPGKASGLDVLATVRERTPGTQVIVMTAFATPETAIEALKMGAYDYLTKPFRIDEVRAVLERALEKHSLLAENHYLRKVLEDNRSYGEMLGASQAMQGIFQMMQRVAPTKTTVLVQGESGTGKELVARGIHDHSGLSGEFVPVNCGAIPENLIEGELFGYVKGAFTGANETRDGLFHAAAGGTLFLDEVGELPLAAQVRLLRAVQEKTVRRVGDSREMPVDVRIVAATNRDLREEVDAGRFREDLYYRLAVISLEVPPLRRRGGDVRLLVEHFVQHFADAAGRTIECIDQEAMHILLQYSYPGNIRELQNILERAVTLELTDTITIDSLPPHVVQSRSAAKQHAGADFGDEGMNLEEYLDSIERDCLMRALELTDGNRTEAAKLLNISFRSIRYRLRKFGFDE